MSSNPARAGRSANPRGRPAGPDTQDIRGAILDAAERLFAQRGHAATSMREIAQQVEVTPAMVHYYFGSKHALLQQVLERTLEPLAGAIAEMRAAGEAPVQAIVALLLETLDAHPNLPILIAREVMLPGGEMQEHFLKFLAPRLGGSLPGLLDREQLNGRMRPTLDPRISSLLLLALCAFPFMARDLAGPALQIDYGPGGVERLQQHINELLREGFAP